MSWEVIGAVGEVVGAVAVLATLLYLAVQIRQNIDQLAQSSDAIALSRRDSVTSSFSRWRQLLDANLPGIFSRHPQHQTEPAKWPTETNERISPNRLANGQSLVRDRKTSTANTPRNRVNFWPSVCLYWERLCSRDSMAVGGVGGELVSGCGSLLSREGTGKSSTSRR